MTRNLHFGNQVAGGFVGAAFARVAALMMAALLVAGVFAAMPSRAVAAEVNQPDPSAGISLLVKDQHDDAFIQGTQVDIYRVADVSADGTLAPAGTFATLPVSWDIQTEADARILADTLAAYVARDAFAPTDSAITDANGVAAFPSAAAQLEPGYYLVLAGAHQAGSAWHYPVASLAALPYVYADGSVDYAPIVTMKYQEQQGLGVLDVFKVWEGENANQPKSVTIQLLRNGQVYKTAVLNESNGWHVQWTGLEPQYQWSVLEESVSDGYTIGLDGNSGIVAVTNTYTNPEIDNPEDPTPDDPSNPQGEEPEDPQGVSGGSGETAKDSTLPQTGQLWWPVAALLMAGVVLLAVGVSRKLRAR